MDTKEGLKKGLDTSTGRNEELTSGVRIARILFACLTTTFAVSVTIQIFIAGLAIFVNPLNWARHEMFSHMIHVLSLVILVFSFVGRLSRKIRWQSFGLFGLMYAMFFTANITVISPFTAAVHPVIAMVLFWMSITIVMKAWRLTKVKAEIE